VTPNRLEWLAAAHATLVRAADRWYARQLARDAHDTLWEMGVSRKGRGRALRGWRSRSIAELAALADAAREMHAAGWRVRIPSVLPSP
jgi:hypothetical protein